MAVIRHATAISDGRCFMCSIKQATLEKVAHSRRTTWVSDSRWQRARDCCHRGLQPITVKTETHSGCSLHPIVRCSHHPSTINSRFPTRSMTDTAPSVRRAAGSLLSSASTIADPSSGESWRHAKTSNLRSSRHLLDTVSDINEGQPPAERLRLQQQRSDNDHKIKSKSMAAGRSTVLFRLVLVLMAFAFGSWAPGSERPHQA